MFEFLKGWGSLVIAALALLQPWVIAIWKRLFRQGSIDIHETASIEGGYSGFGPTIGLHGTLRALHRDQFVRSIDLAVIKLKDSSRHLFEWGVFRAERLTVGSARDMSLELPSGFMLTTTHPHRYNIQFFDVRVQNEMRPHIVRVREAWTEWFLEAGGSRLLESGTDLSALSAEIDRASRSVYEEFSKTPPHYEVFSALDRLCYWEAGEYSLEMRVNTSRPDRSFGRKWKFELTKSEADSFRLNALKVVQDACGRSYGQYNFAYAQYKTHA